MLYPNFFDLSRMAGAPQPSFTPHDFLAHRVLGAPPIPYSPPMAPHMPISGPFMGSSPLANPPMHMPFNFQGSPYGSLGALGGAPPRQLPFRY
jgi:hypothetical protein